MSWRLIGILLDEAVVCIVFCPPELLEAGDEETMVLVCGEPSSGTGEFLVGVPGYSWLLASIISLLLCRVSESSLTAGGGSCVG